MQITCPKGCHHKSNWSYSLEGHECYEDGEVIEYILGETCDKCGSEVCIFDPEAERDYRRYRVRQLLRFLLWVIVWASVAAVAIWVVP